MLIVILNKFLQVRSVTVLQVKIASADALIMSIVLLKKEKEGNILF